MRSGKTPDMAGIPIVSVVIPCYDQARFLPEAVESIVKQTYSNWECIIVNDGSADNTGEVSKRLKADHPQHAISLVEKEHGGLAGARNSGVAVSRGKYVLPLDADDMLGPTMIEKCAALLESDADIAIAYTSIQQFGDAHAAIPSEEYDLHALCRTNLLPPAALFRREAFDAAGGYNTNMVSGYEDWDFWIGCAEKGLYGRLVPEPLFLKRIREDGLHSRSLQHDTVMKARIILNHQSLFTKSQIGWAEGVIAGDSDILSLPEISGTIPEFYEPQEIPPDETPLSEEMKKEVRTAMQFHQSGDLRQAAQIYRKILDDRPDLDRVNYELANLLYDAGEPSGAIPYYAKTLQLNPGLIDVYNDLGLAYQEAGQLDEAVKCFSKALLLDPGFIDAAYNLGLAFEGKGCPDAAVKSYQKVIDTNPEFEDAYINLGNAYLRKGSFDDAVSSYKKALELNPQLAEARNNLGYALLEKRQIEEAIENFKQAAELNPNVADTYFNLGNAYKILHDFDEAVSNYDRVLAISPNVPEVYLNKGDIFAFIGRNEDALAEYGKALDLNPSFFVARFAQCMAQIKPVYPDQKSIQSARSLYQEELAGLKNFIDFNEPEEIEKASNAVGSQQPFLLAYQGMDDRSLQKDYGDLICRLMSSTYPLFSERPPMPPCSGSEPIRVGIVSGYFYSHSNWKIPVRGWAENLDKQRFRLYGYYTGEKTDQETERARQCFASFTEGVYSFEELCRRIKNDRLHLLIFPEIGMDPTTVRLAALRLAPVQCASWGHPDTSGLPTIDYYLSSDLMEPADADRLYTEQLIRLPNLSISYTPPDMPRISAGRDELGMPAGSVLYLCSQALSKYLPQYDEVFPKIALQVENSQFMFISDRSGIITDQFRSRLDASFRRFGLAADRYAVFLPRLDPVHYDAINTLSDVYLDSIGWSGCNSTFEAIARDLPVVTLPGDLMRGRHSSAILTMMGITELIAASADEYVSLAVRLGQDAEWRKEISDRIASAKQRVYQDRACIAGLEQFIEKVVKGTQAEA